MAVACHYAIKVTIYNCRSSRSRARSTPDLRTRHIIGLLVRTFRDFIHIALCGAGGARTHDRRIMRSTALCIVRTTCTNTTESCHRWP